MRVGAIVVALGIALALLTGCSEEPPEVMDVVIGTPGGGTRATRVVDGLAFTIETTRSVFSQREDLTTALTLENRSATTKTWHSIGIGRVVRGESGEVGWTEGLGVPYGRSFPSLTLGPGESTTTVVGGWPADRPEEYVIFGEYRGGRSGTEVQTPEIRVTVR